MESADLSADARARSGPVVAAVLVTALAIVAWMLRGWFAGTLPLTGDLLHFHVPLRDFYARALRAGHAVSWMPGLFNGFYIAGEGQLGAYHPLHWALYRWLPLTQAFALETVVAYPFAGAGAWLWLRPWCGHAGAAVGALLFATCGFQLSHGVHPNMVSVTAHLPWLLWACDRAVAAPGWRAAARGAAVIALLIGSQLLLGHPQATWITGLAVASYVVVVGGPGSPARRLRAAAVAVCGLALGLAAGAVQAAATLDAVTHSLRPAFDRSFATQFALHPSALPTLVQPYAAWGRVARWNATAGAGDEYGVYLGAAALVLGAWWLAWAAPIRRSPAPAVGHEGASPLVPGQWRLALWACGLAGAGVWLATGAHGGLYLLQTKLPVVGMFRAPVRFVLFPQFAGACLAALAVAALTTRAAEGPRGVAAGAGAPERHAARRALWAPWLAVACVVAVTPLVRPAVDPSAVSFAALAAGPAAAAGLALLLSLAVRGTPAALPLVVLLAAADQVVYGIAGVIAWQDVLPERDVIPLLGEARYRPRAEEGRIVRGGFPNLYLLGGYRLVDGYVAIAPRRQLRYDAVGPLRLSAAAWAHKDVLPPDVTEGATLLGGEWFRIPEPLPRLRLVERALVSRTPDVDLGVIDVSMAAIVDRVVGLPAPASGAGLAEDGTRRAVGGPIADGAGGGDMAIITEDVPGAVSARVVAAGRRLVVLSESYDEGWTAEIDGEPVPVVRVNGDFLGCVVPGGMHRVAFVFAPAHLRWGGAMSVAAMLVAAGLLLTTREDRGGTSGGGSRLAAAPRA